MASLSPERPRRRRRQFRRARVAIPPAVLRAEQLAAFLGYRCSDTARRLRQDPLFPQPIRPLGPKSRPLWLVSEVEAFLRQKRAAHRPHEIPQEGPPPFRPGASADVPEAEEARIATHPSEPSCRPDLGIVPSSTASDPEAEATPHPGGGTAECARDAGGGPRSDDVADRAGEERLNSAGQSTKGSLAGSRPRDTLRGAGASRATAEAQNRPHDCSQMVCPHGKCWRCGDCFCMEEPEDSASFSEAAGLRDLGWKA